MDWDNSSCTGSVDGHSIWGSQDPTSFNFLSDACHPETRSLAPSDEYLSNQRILSGFPLGQVQVDPGLTLKNLAKLSNLEW